MIQKQLQKATASSMKDSIPTFGIGDTVSVSVRIVEGDKERIQHFVGTVIAREGGGVGESVTVRRIVANQGVERKFPLHSPKVADIEVVRRGHVRRAKLFYLRDRVGKATRIREKKESLETRKQRENRKRAAAQAVQAVQAQESPEHSAQEAAAAAEQR